MRGDSEYSGQHQHGVKESAQPASGVHRMTRDLPSESKEITKVSTSFRGHMLLTFADGSTHELQRGDYPHNVAPKVGEFYPPIQEALLSESAEPSSASPPSEESAEE